MAYHITISDLQQATTIASGTFEAEDDNRAIQMAHALEDAFPTATLMLTKDADPVILVS